MSSTSPRTPIRSETKDGPIRERKRKGGSVSDKFFIDPTKIPPGISYEWKRETLYGASDPSYSVSLAENGWEPVDVSRHPEFMPPGFSGPIRRDGMILMERPIELTEEARAEDRMNAIEIVRSKEMQLGQTPANTLPRDADPRTAPRLSRSYAPVEIPED